VSRQHVLPVAIGHGLEVPLPSEKIAGRNESRETFDPAAEHSPDTGEVLTNFFTPRGDAPGAASPFSKKSFIFSAFHSSGTHELCYLFHPAHP
jgi:hypothetical protein